MERTPLENTAELTAEKNAAMEIVIQHISKYDFVRVDGRYKDITIANLSLSEYDLLYEALEQLKVFPWIEEEKEGKHTLVVERQKELQTLHSFFKAREVSTEEDQPSHPRAVPIDDYRFPLQPSVEFSKDVKPPNQNRVARRKNTAVYEEDIGVDEELRLRANDFDKGLDIDGDSSFYRTTEGKRINLKQFPQQWFFKKGKIFDKEGVELSLEEHKEIILAAKNSPEEMTEAIKLSTGLVVAVVNRILEKYNGYVVISADDLFQVGMEGLMYGLERIEGREDSSPSSYLVPCIEGYIRRELSLHRKLWRQPNHVSQEIGRLHKARKSLERNDESFHSLSVTEQLQKIAAETGMPLIKVEQLHQLSQAEAEEFDDENQEHNVREDNNPMIDIEGLDYQKLKLELKEILSSLTAREDLMVRLYFCIPDSSPRWREDLQKTGEEMFGAAFGNNGLSRGSFEYLVQTDIANIRQLELNAAERVFLVLIGKLPESDIADLEQHGKEQPSKVTLENTGVVLGVSLERSRQIISKALRLMKHPSRSRKLRKFMDKSDKYRRRY